MSPCEKACGNAIAKAGGRMLFLSLYPEMARQPTRKELYDRCHEMGDVVLEGLARQ